LRSRRKDIPELIDYFVKHFAKKHIKKINKVSKLVVSELTNYPWPGNIRELENVLERAVIVCNTNTIKIKDIGPVIAEPNQTKRRHSFIPIGRFMVPLEQQSCWGSIPVHYVPE
jgi:DNA-binding NtrC family response regulator